MTYPKVIFEDDYHNNKGEEFRLRLVVEKMGERKDYTLEMRVRQDRMGDWSWESAKDEYKGQEQFDFKFIIKHRDSMVANYRKERIRFFHLLTKAILVEEGMVNLAGDKD